MALLPVHGNPLQPLEPADPSQGVGNKADAPTVEPGQSGHLDREDELLRLARAGEVRLGAGNSVPRYERPNRGNQLPHEEVMAILNAVRSNP